MWVGDGQEITEDGAVVGDLIDTSRDSYWQSGWFAAFRSWKKLIVKYLNAQHVFEETGDEGALKTVYNTGFAAPYLEMALSGSKV